MKKIFFLILILFFLSALSIFFSTRILRAKKTEINIRTIPESSVFIDGKEKGTTPYESSDISPGQRILKLVPKDSGLPAWERTLTLSPSTQLFIRWEFSADPDQQQGDIVYLEKIAQKEGLGLVLTSNPNNASVSIDGQTNEFSPVNLDSLTAGDHKIVVSYPGYQNREFLVKAIPGYRLVVETKLAVKPNEEQSIKESDQSNKQTEPEPTLPQVVIKNTPTGWLRVRMEPSLSATEAAKVKPGEKYTLLDEKNGWYKISYKEGEEGWISGRYAKKLD
jgi:hypothetical protein